MTTILTNLAVFAQLLEVRHDGSFGHCVSFGGDIGVNVSDDFLRIRDSFLHSFKDVSLAF
jgi:hypothetical protein